MRVVGLPRSFYYTNTHSILALSSTAQVRWRMVESWQALRAQGLSSTKASQVLHLPRATLYRWASRLASQGPQGLEEQSRGPHHRRQPTWSPLMAQAVLKLRETYPRWGKDKLVVLLRREGWQISTSMVGRILTALKQRRQLVEAPLGIVSATRRPLRRPYAVRKPKEYQANLPGDLVQVDTVDLRPLPGVILKQFTARDVISRWDVLEVRTRATATTARDFLATLIQRLPFPLRAIQVDGGSEFMAEFEAACQDQGIHLFVLPPHSPKLNGRVERANRTHTEEFYQVYDGDLNLAALGPALLEWEHTYNTIRPHQALDWQTPLEYLQHCHPELALSLSHM